MMDDRLLSLLLCPACGCCLHWHRDKAACPDCYDHYPIVGDIPRFTTDRGLESFSEEWTRFSQTQLDSVSGTGESLAVFKAKTGFDLGKMRGKLVLDAGCGAGRFTEVALDAGARVVAVDASQAVESAYRNVCRRLGVLVVQADIHKLPLAPATFDYIFSIGVLHHTPDTRKAFLSLPELLKPEGEIAIWVYSADSFPFRIYNAVSGVYRVVTTKLPHETVLRWARFLAKTTYPVRRVPVLREAVTVLVPSSGHPNVEWRVLDNFDWYSAKHQHKHTFEEVESWFDEAGLEHKRLGVPVAVWGKRRG